MAGTSRPSKGSAAAGSTDDPGPAETGAGTFGSGSADPQASALQTDAAPQSAPEPEPEAAVPVPAGSDQPSFAIDRLRNPTEGPQITGLAYPVIVGALHDSDRDEMTADEVREKASEFLNRPTATEES